MSMNIRRPEFCVFAVRSGHNANSVHSHPAAVGCLVQHSCAVVTKATVGWWVRWPFLRQWRPLATRSVQLNQLNGATWWIVSWSNAKIESNSGICCFLTLACFGLGAKSQVFAKTWNLEIKCLNNLRERKEENSRLKKKANVCPLCFQFRLWYASSIKVLTLLCAKVQFFCCWLCIWPRSGQPIFMLFLVRKWQAYIYQALCPWVCEFCTWKLPDALESWQNY